MKTGIQKTEEDNWIPASAGMADRRTGILNRKLGWLNWEKFCIWDDGVRKTLNCQHDF